MKSEHAEQEPRVAAEVVDALVERPQRALEPEAHEQGRARGRAGAGRSARRRGRTARTSPGRTRPRARGTPDVVAADREDEADRAEQDGRGTAERPLEEDDRGDVARAPGVAARRLPDPHGVAADRGRQDLPRGVRDEVRPRQPGERVLDPLRGEQPLPAQRHRQRRHDHDRDREREPPRIGVEQHVDRLLQIDLPDEVRDREPGEDGGRSRS